MGSVRTPSSSATARAVVPHIVVRDARAAIDFYVRAFGAVEAFRLTEPSGKVGHAELTIDGARFMLADEYPDFGALSPAATGGTPVALQCYVADVDAFVERAVNAGATLLRPVRDEFYGDRTGTLQDPFGHKWHFATKKEEVPPAEMQRRWSAILT